MMGVFLRLSVFIGLLILSCVGLAQESNAPAPWPPNPDDIFAEGVQWKPLTYGMPDGPANVDYARDVIRVLDEKTGQWREYPYPVANVPYTLSVQMLPSGLVSVYVYQGDGGDPRPGSVFFLNPATGAYTEPPTICEGKVIQAEAGMGKWVLAYHDKAETQPFLCQSETGEQRDALPAQPEGTEWRIYSNASDTFLLFIGKNFHYADEIGFKVYSYNLADEELTLLGGIDWRYGDFAWLCGWVSDTEGLVCSSGLSSWMGNGYYSFELAQANNLEYVFYGWEQDTFRLEDPTRYISADTARYSGARTGTEASERPCSVSVYDATGFREHEIGADCVPILLDSNTIAPFYRQENSLYFLATTGQEGKVSRLTRYDMQQETITEIGPPAEIENIISISPDERYIVVLMDENDTLDFPWQAYETSCCPQQYGWFLTIIDAEADEIIYMSEPLGVYTSSDVKWLDDETVVITSSEIYKEIRATDEGASILFAPPATLRQIHLGEVLTTQSMALDINIAVPNRYGLQGKNTLIDLRSFETVSIFQEDVLEAYSIRMRWDEENGDLVVSVKPSDDSDTSASYRVSLP